MKLDVITVRTLPEDWELNLILRERDYERRIRTVRTPQQSFYRGLGLGILASCAIWAVLYWRFVA